MLRKRRKDSYFGLHFDFHANERLVGIGTKTKAENIDKLLETVRPDFIQVDAKGHPGLTSFVTAYGNAAPGLAVNHLELLRKETEKYGVALYAHYSGVMDRHACTQHPEWAAEYVDHKRSPNITTLSSFAYADELLIPQLKELAQRYGLDGAWVDGECWAVNRSWRPEEIADFCKQSGFDHVDEDPKSPSHQAYAEYWRKKFLAYMEHYMQAVHETCPDFQMTSNFAFSQEMSLKPIDEIDYLSGDTAGLEGRLTPRCFVGLGKPWDVMGYGFAGNYMTEDPTVYPLTTKHIDRICRDAAMAISQGGGFQIVNNMSHFGEIRMYDLDRLKQLSDFMYARKPWCFRSQPMKNPAFLLSSYNENRKIVRDNPAYWPLHGLNNAGLCDAVLDSGLPCDIVYDFQLDDPQRNTLIIPDGISFMSDEIKGKLRRFAENGGSLIVIGREPCKLLADLADAEVRDFDGAVVYTECGGSMLGMHEAVIFEKKGAEDLMTCYRDVMDPDAERISAVITNPCGKGRVVFVGYDLNANYVKHHSFECCTVMRKILSFVDPAPNAYLESGIHRVDLVPSTSDGKLLVNLINTTEITCDEGCNAAGEIPPLYDLTVAVKCPTAPKSVTLEPEHRPAEYTYDGQYLHVKVEKLAIHSILVVEP